MKKQNWTAEPWIWEESAAGQNVRRVDIFTAERPMPGIAGHYINSDEDRANMARIVACVNACAGIADPAALRQQRDDLLAACGAADTYISVLAAQGFSRNLQPSEATRAVILQLRAAIAGIADPAALRRQRDDLLAACQLVLRAMEWATPTDQLPAQAQADLLRAAIAKAQAGEP